MTKQLTPSQTRKIESFRAFLTKELDANSTRGDTISNFEVTTTERGGVWIVADTCMEGLPEGNLLRAVSAQHWHLHIGRGGRVEVWSAPKSFDQFKGRYAFNMFFKKI